jgi:hypothetical protein
LKTVIMRVILVRLLRVQCGLHLVIPIAMVGLLMYCGVVLGTTFPTIRVLLPATVTHKTARTSTSVFVFCGLFSPVGYCPIALCPLVLYTLFKDFKAQGVVEKSEKRRKSE